ncbi:deoxyuridine 5'-triphosphate nucleotidohydrolase, mitochondrial-like [Carlito syrichta]|uniref:Deoxyuridine 5'-triphosphate nucleotidohydrolase n=1 Tax=Carlito syrichta TaxID=1868482 RepID=A0A1U7SQX9_CARSF|nr:deoxyuridine 5'-triphosphate nucleotidohydrolase, mitochondrial-like [Carlito syrichta]
MDCSEKTPTISHSKHLRPVGEGGVQLHFARLSEHASARPGCLRRPHSAYDYTIPPMEKVLVETDIQIALPSRCSGLASKCFTDVGTGVIDEDYRENVGAVLFNFGKEKFEVKKCDQAGCSFVNEFFNSEIEEVQVLDDTERGTGGFCSTGKN